MLTVRRFIGSNSLIGKVPTAPLQSSRLFSTNVSIDSQLAVFPEFKEAVVHESNGKFAMALPAYERTFDSLHAVVGIESPLTTSLLYRMSNLHRYLGQYNKSLHLLQTHIPKIQKNLEEKIKLQHLQSVVHILAGQPQQALSIAEASVKLCEEQDHHQDNPLSRLFSSVYGTLGICYLVNQDLHEAETFLQMSCRWAETPTEQLISTTNNGSLLWYRLANNPQNNPESFHYWKVQQEKILAKIPFLSSKENESKGEVESLRKIQKDSTIYKNNVVHTLNGWLEAMEEAQKGQLTHGTTGCGPMNMTGLQSNDVTMVTDSSSSQKTAPDSNSLSALEEKLKADVKFSIAYAHLLYQIADIYELTGKYSESSDYLTSAMKALSHPSSSTATITSPYLGKILRQIAYYHMCNTQAVTAEGLYRAALEKFSSPYSLHDVRYQYDVALTKGYYGQLLKKWDKRETIGEKQIEEYQQFLQQQFPFMNDNNKGFYHLTSMIQFPIDFM